MLLRPLSLGFGEGEITMSQWLLALFSLCNFPSALYSQKQIIVDPLAFTEERFRPSLEERLESIISGAALMADSSCTRDDRRERIVAECNSVRQALQDLLSEYMGNVSVLPLLCFTFAILSVLIHSSTAFSILVSHSVICSQTMDVIWLFGRTSFPGFYPADCNLQGSKTTDCE